MLGVVACSSPNDASDSGDVRQSEALTYYRDVKAIVDARCATCHAAGNIGPFPLTTYDEIRSSAPAVQASIESGTMPPWQPSADCNTYLGNIDLSEREKDTLLAWLDADMPEGDPADTSTSSGGPAPSTFEPDLSLRLPEPYTPTREPDDYRCQLIPWPATEARFVTGLRVKPDQRSIVHHAIVFVAGPDQVEQYRAYDDAEPGPGYTCYGGPTASDGDGGLGDIDLTDVLRAIDRLGLSIGDLQAGNVTADELSALLSEIGVDNQVDSFASLGSWVPGVPNSAFPEGTGIRVEPGSMLVVQMHYNTLSSAPVPDQSVVEIATTDAVEREATMLAILDLGWVSNGLIGDPMTIPAGAPDVQHSTVAGFDSVLLARSRQALGLAEDAALVMHTANHHMHELGTHQRTELRHADGSSTCVLDIPDWDFAWQGSYTLSQPIPIRAGDELWMGCTWNNTAANQPIIDGVVRDPIDVSWGEGTTDEMCLGAFYVTAAP